MFIDIESFESKIILVVACIGPKTVIFINQKERELIKQLFTFLREKRPKAIISYNHEKELRRRAKFHHIRGPRIPWTVVVPSPVYSD